MPQKPRDSDAKRPLFSIAIPAYKDKTLLGLALTSILTQSIADLEVIVSDDSSSDELQALVAATGDSRVIYCRRGAPPGAVANWNYCLGLCRGRYVVLMHHDERFAHPDCLSSLEKEFQATHAEVLISSLTLETSDGLRPFGPGRTLVRQISARLCPRVLLIDNAVGPTSTLALQEQARLVRFDERLTWLVDVEYYVRLFSGRRVRLCSSSRLISRLDHEHRITSALDTESVAAAERRKILEREPAFAARAFLRVGWAAYAAARAVKRRLLAATAAR